ncbi:MAG: helix-turn-helix domain-containing protein [Clostridia bacterium]|nr:helix-turn-helix domain-containing protein [Clostridia bacterium]
MITHVPCLIAPCLSITELYTFFNIRYPQNFYFKGERHDFFEVVCVLDGKVGVTADKNIFILSEGQMIIHPSNEFHAIWAADDYKPEVIIFSFSASEFPDISRYVWDISQGQMAELRDIFYLFGQSFDIKKIAIKEIRPEMRLHAAVAVKRLELFMLNVFSSPETQQSVIMPTKSEAYTRILTAMENNLSRSLTVDELSRICNMSVPALEKTVYKYLHCGAISHFNALKMKKATELLSEGKNVNETAFALGFANQNYFSTAFKKYYGYPPSKLKKSL